MILLIIVVLHCVILTSSKAVFRFHGAAEYGVMHDDRPASRRQTSVRTTVMSRIDEDVKLNLPHAMDQNSISNTDDRASSNGEERTLPILRTETETAIKPAVQPQSTYVLMGSTDERVEPQREILHAAEVLDVGHSEDRPPPQREVVLRNSLTQVELIPTDVVPVIITTTATPAPTTITMVLPTSVTTSEEPEKIDDKKEPSFIKQVEEKGRVLEKIVDKKEPSFIKQVEEKGRVLEKIDDKKEPSFIEQVEEKGRVLEKIVDKKEPSFIEQVEEKGHALEAIDDLPSAKTFVLDVAKEVLPKSSKEELVVEIKTDITAMDEVKADPTAVVPSEHRSKEDEEDADTLPEFDEKSDVELEFHDDADIATTLTPEVVVTSAAPEVTSSLPVMTAEATTEELPTSFPDSAEKEFLAEEDIYDLIMFLVTLLPEVEEQSRWSRIIAGLQCALRDCRRAFPRLTTVATPVGNGTFIIRRARSECLCSISRSQDVEKP